MLLDKRRRWILAGWFCQLALLAIVGRLFADKVRDIVREAEANRHQHVTIEMGGITDKLNDIEANQVRILESQERLLSAQVEQLELLGVMRKQ